MRLQLRFYTCGIFHSWVNLLIVVLDKLSLNLEVHSAKLKTTQQRFEGQFENIK